MAFIGINQIPSPSYVLEEEKLRQNLELVSGVAEAAGVHIILALKAYAFWPTFPLIGEYLHGATASSLNEARLIHEEMGVRPHTYSPAYFPEELPKLAAISSHITFNSLTELERHRAVWSDRERYPDLSTGLRVNPEYSPVATDLYNPAGPTGRLGETAPNLPDLPPPGLEGIHAHTLCESPAATTGTLIEEIEERFGGWLPHLKWINLGGGHLMTRPGYDRDELIGLLRAFRERHPHLHVIMEPGSAIAWGTGFLVTRVLDIMDNYGQQIALLDVSFTAHMPDTLEMPYRPVVRNASAEMKDGWFPYQLGGISCLAGDFLANYYFEQPLQVGDRLVFEDMLHYTTVKTTMFNGVAHPNLAILKPGGSLEVVRRFGYEDYKQRMG